MALRDRLQKVPQWFLASPIRLLVLPYIVGIVWHALHPIASIFTGDFSNPRRWYIDESSLEPSYFQTSLSYDLVQQTVYTGSYKQDVQFHVNSLCQGVKEFELSVTFPDKTSRDGALASEGKIPCYRHDMQNRSSFELIRIVPHSAAISPTSEAIVLVIPAIQPFLHVHHLPRGSHTNGDKSQNQFQASILQLIYRLAYQSPWLAKTILVVAPINDYSTKRFTTKANDRTLNPLLDQTAKDFLDSYLGRSVLPEQRLPMEWTGAFLRNLIVVDMETFPSDNRPLPSSNTNDFEPQQGELRILPQGRNGVLPNMDLVFTVRTVYDRSALMFTQPLTVYDKKKYKMNSLAVHPYGKEVGLLHQKLKDYGLPRRLEIWAMKMLNLLAFEYTLAIGAKPPHAIALDYGIDSLTLQASFVKAVDKDDYDERKGNRPNAKQSPQEYPREYVQRLEFIIRSLSSLHERLHHSTSLYLLASPDRFVKHEEYLVPNLLLMIPLVIRSLLILFRTDPVGLDLTAGLATFGGAAAWTCVYSHLLAGDLGNRSNPLRVLGIYIVFVILAARLGETSCVRGMQFMSCMAAALVHAALAFGHVSLSFLSALFWTPLLAFPEMWAGKDGPSLLSSFIIIQVIVALLTSPFIALMMPTLGPELSEYMQFAFVPLHFLLVVSCITAARKQLVAGSGTIESPR